MSKEVAVVFVVSFEEEVSDKSVVAVYTKSSIDDLLLIGRNHQSSTFGRK